MNDEMLLGQYGERFARVLRVAIDLTAIDDDQLTRYADQAEAAGWTDVTRPADMRRAWKEAGGTDDDCPRWLLVPMGVPPDQHPLRQLTDRSGIKSKIDIDINLDV